MIPAMHKASSIALCALLSLIFAGCAGTPRSFYVLTADGPAPSGGGPRDCVLARPGPSTITLGQIEDNV